MARILLNEEQAVAPVTGLERLIKLQSFEKELSSIINHKSVLMIQIAS
jgi:hypothetical protein